MYHNSMGYHEDTPKKKKAYSSKSLHLKNQKDLNK